VTCPGGQGDLSVGTAAASGERGSAVSSRTPRRGIHFRNQNSNFNLADFPETDFYLARRLDGILQTTSGGDPGASELSEVSLSG